VVLDFKGRKIFLLDAFRYNVPCQFYRHFVYLLSAAYIGVTDKLVRCPTVDKNHIKHHKTLAHATF